MILTDWQIKEEIESGRISVGPYDPTLINPSSLDFRLGRHYTKTIALKAAKRGTWSFPQQGSPCIWEPSYYYIDPTDKTSFETKTEEHIEYELAPGEVILVSMLEYLALPDDISAKILGKSSTARLGLQNSAEAGFVDPGWAGVLTLEVSNKSKYPILLKEGMKIGQLIFFKHELTEKSYQETGRYNNQKPGTGSFGV